MANTRSSQLNAFDWLAEGALAPYVDAFRQYLTDRGYATTTFVSCMGSIAHFAQWLHGRRLRVARIDEAAVAEFLTIIFLGVIAVAGSSAIDAV